MVLEVPENNNICRQGTPSQAALVLEDMSGKTKVIWLSLIHI